MLLVEAIVDGSRRTVMSLTYEWKTCFCLMGKWRNGKQMRAIHPANFSS